MIWKVFLLAGIGLAVCYCVARVSNKFVKKKKKKNANM